MLFGSFGFRGFSIHLICLHLFFGLVLLMFALLFLFGGCYVAVRVLLRRSGGLRPLGIQIYELLVVLTSARVGRVSILAAAGSLDVVLLAVLAQVSRLTASEAPSLLHFN